MIADTLSTSGSAPATCEFTACLDRVRAGHQDAARELVRRVEPMVYRIIRTHLPRRDAPEDIAQEVFMKMFLRLDQYRGASSFRRWLSQVTLRTCFDHLRAQRCRPELRRADLSEEESQHLDRTLIDENRHAASDVRAVRELLDQLLAQLTPEDRQVVVLFNLQQKSIAEISELTQWSRDLVKMRVFRARRKLRRYLARMPHWDNPMNEAQRLLSHKIRRSAPRLLPVKKIAPADVPFVHPRAA